MSETQPTTPVEVTQEDREAAAELWHWINGQYVMAEDQMRSGTYDDDERVQAFARHRLSTRPTTETLREANPSGGKSMTERDWSDLCSILTNIDTAIIGAERRAGGWGKPSPAMQAALNIARRRHEEAVKDRAALSKGEG